MIGWCPETINTSVVVTNCGRSGSLHSEYQYVWDLVPELSDPNRPVNFLRSGALIRACWLPNRATNVLCWRAAIRARSVPRRATHVLRSGAHWVPNRSKPRTIRSSYQSSLTPWSISDRSKTSRDQKLLLELIDSIVDQQPSCARELLSNLIYSLIDQNLLAIRSSYESTLTTWKTYRLVEIWSSYES